MVIGYARVSTREQSLDRQLDALKAAGCERIYQEKRTGAKMERPELSRLLDAIRAGDTIIITELARLGRSTLELMELVGKLKADGVTLVSLKEQFDTRTAAGQLMLQISMTLAQFERDLLRERTMEGLAAARARGKRGGRPKVDPAKLKDALTMSESGKYSLKEIVRRSGVSAASIYRYKKERDAK